MSSDRDSKNSPWSDKEREDAQKMLRDSAKSFTTNKLFLGIVLLACGGLAVRAAYDAFRNFRIIEHPPHVVGLNWDAALGVLLFGYGAGWAIYRMIRLRDREAAEKDRRPE